jgi:hypothetical protein
MNEPAIFEKQDERGAFEAWMRSRDETHLFRRDAPGSTKVGQYCRQSVRDQWETWQARAALQAAPAAEQSEPVYQLWFDSQDRWIETSEELYAKQMCKKRILYAAPQPAADAPGMAEPVAKTCWSCNLPYSEERRLEEDGHCPHCGVEIHIDAVAQPVEQTRALVCLICNSTGESTPCAYPTEINRQQAKRIAELVADVAENDALIDSLRAQIAARPASGETDAN